MPRQRRPPTRYLKTDIDTQDNLRTQIGRQVQIPQRAPYPWMIQINKPDKPDQNSSPPISRNGIHNSLKIQNYKPARRRIQIKTTTGNPPPTNRIR